MFCLTQQIRSSIAGIGLAVGDDQDLAGTGDHINGHLAEDLLLGLRHEGIAGADDLIHLGNAFRAIGQRSNCLSAAHLKDLIHTGDLGSRQDHGIDLAFGIGGCDHHHLLHTGNFGGDGIHQYRGGVGGGAAGDVQTRPVHGDDLLTHHHTGGIVEGEAPTQLHGVEGTDVFSGLFQNGHKFRRYGGKCLFDLLRGYRKGRKLCFVEFFRIGKQGSVALFFYIFNDIGHNGFHIHLGNHPGEDLLVLHLAVFEYLDHTFASNCAPSSATRVSISAVLNL